MAEIRRWVDQLRRTPLHPQWLLAEDRQKLRPALQSLRGVVLDVGCADRWVEGALPGECTYLGLDYPPTGGELYRSHPDVFGDATLLPFSSAGLDAVVMLEVLEHVRYPDRAVREAARVLRRGGLLILSMPFLYPVHDSPHDYQRFTRHGLEREIHDAGFDLLRIEKLGSATESAALIANLALAGVMAQAIRTRSPAVLLLPLFGVLIPIINLLAAGCGRLLPDWDAMSHGYWLLAQRRFDDEPAANQPSEPGSEGTTPESA